MAKDRSTCLKWFMAEQKCVIVVAATLVFFMGSSLFLGSAGALKSTNVQEDAGMSSEFSHGEMDLIKMLKSICSFGFFTMLASILGCCGACRENKCCLFLYSLTGILFATTFMILGIMSQSVIEVQAPNLIRASNRICANAATMEANDLKCNNQTAQVALGNMVSTFTEAPATVAPPVTGGVTPPTTSTTNRRLTDFLGAAADEADWFGPGTTGHAMAFAAARMIGQRAEQQAEPGSLPEVFSVSEEGRRLAAGTSEKQLVMKVGGSNPCGFVEAMCAPPEGFNPITACICEGGKNANVKSSAYGSFCNDWNKQSGVAGHAPGPAENWCYVTAGSLCDSSYESVTAMTGDVASSAPCAGTPDYRSKMVKDGIGLVEMVVKLVLGTGILLALSVIFSCCLCCEIHTGKNAVEHGREFAQVSDSDYSD